MKRIFTLIIICSMTLSMSVYANDTVNLLQTEDITIEKKDLTLQNKDALKYINGEREVLVIIYHKLSKNPLEWSEWCTSPENFEKDIIYLKEKGYVFLKASELMSIKYSNAKKVAVITFDDGYMSDYEYALPILEKHNIKATFFIIGGFVGKEEYMGENEIKNLSKSHLCEIGNHSLNLHFKTYKEIKQMFALNPNLVFEDFMVNKNYLEKVIGKKVESCSYPNGIYTQTVDYRLKISGIKISFSTGTEKFTTSSFSTIGRKNRAHSITMEYYVK